MALNKKLMRGKLSAFFICLAISGFLWISHTLNQLYSYSLIVPVKFVNLPNNKLLVNSLPENLRFDIKTSGLKLLFVLLNKPFKELTIDFNTLKGDNKLHSYSIGASNVALESVIKFNVTVQKISPDTLFFTSKKGISKNVAVKPVLFINPDKGITISKPIINPAFITITGDSASLRNIDSISTTPLYLNQLNKNYIGKLALVRPSESVYLNINEVSVSIQSDKLLEKELLIPVEIINRPAGKNIKLFPAKVKVKFTLALNDFEDISEESFKAVIDISKTKKEINKLPVELSILPTQAHIISIEPSEVEYLIFNNP